MKQVSDFIHMVVYGIINLITALLDLVLKIIKVAFVLLLMGLFIIILLVLAGITPDELISILN